MVVFNMLEQEQGDSDPSPHLDGNIIPHSLKTRKYLNKIMEKKLMFW